MLPPKEPPTQAATPQASLPPIRFVILASPRTGSNFLCSFLNSHPQILCHHELFNPKGIHYALDRRDGSFDLGTMDQRDADPAGFVRKVWRLFSGERAVGFKLGVGHPTAAFDEIYEDPGVARIVLRRQNRVKAYVSERIAATEGRWTHYDMRPDEIAPIRVHVDPTALVAWTGMIDRYYTGVLANLRATGRPYLELFYEDLFAPETQARVLAFLGFSPAIEGLSGSTFKRNADDLRKLVINYDELATALRDTPLQADVSITG